MTKYVWSTQFIFNITSRACYYFLLLKTRIKLPCQCNFLNYYVVVVHDMACGLILVCENKSVIPLTNLNEDDEPINKPTYSYTC